MTCRQPLLLMGDCLERLPELPAASVDLILADLPYGTTACKWDSVIPFGPLWAQYKRLLKGGGAVVLTAAQPFASALVLSNPKDYRYDWIWEKTTPTGHLNAKRQPMRAHEHVLVFCATAPPYFPQKTIGHARKTANNVDRAKKLSNVYGAQQGVTSYTSTERYPRSVLKFSTDKQKSAPHPTQKPVALMEYLIHTYTKEGETVLDNVMGSGTTGVACVNTGRRFIGIERNENYFEVASTRINATTLPSVAHD